LHGFQPVNDSSRLSYKVYIQIRDAIAAGRYQSGDKLPTENEFAEIFQVSRTSVREALKLLSGQGLVTVKRGLGAYVARDQGRSYATDLQNIMLHEKKNILELIQIRKILESEAAAWAARAAQPEDINNMEHLLSVAEAMIRDPKFNRQKLNRINTDFHYALVKATGNSTLEKVMSSLMEMLTEVRDITLQLPGRHSGSVAGHRELLEAIKAGDSIRAKAAMDKHLESVETIINSMKPD
jgi:GntR family transcriptional repressor for pyruvate dehydrogenase complex